MAESSPASAHSARNTELSTWRAAGLSPNEMFESPSVVCTSGCRRLSSLIALMVSRPSLRDSSSPVATVNVRQSIMMSDSAIPQLPVRSAISRSAMATLWSAVRAWPCSSMVSATTAAPCSHDHRHDLGEPGLRAVAVLVVHRVDDRAAAEALQPGLDHGRLGGVQHDRQGRCGGHPAGHLGHVDRAVAAHVVDAQVQHVRAVPGLRAGDLDAVVPPSVQHGFPECLGAVGVGPLADHQDGRLLLERDLLVQRGQPRFVAWAPPGRLDLTDRLHHRAQVLGGGAAAPADQAESEFGDEPAQRRRQLIRIQRVDGTLRAEFGQAGVGHRRHSELRVLGQVPQMFAHLGRAGGAVQADEVGVQRGQRGQRRTDLGAEQHGAGGLHRDVHDHRNGDAAGGHGAAGTDDRRLGLQQVLAGLHDDRVDATLQHAGRLLLVGVAQGAVRRVAEGGQLGAGPDRPEHEAGLVGGGELVGLRPGQRGTCMGQLEDPVLDVVLGQVGQVGTEGVRLDRVDAGLEVGPVHRSHDVGSGDVENLVAALESVEVVQTRLGGLQHGAHRPVGHEHPLRQRNEQRMGGGRCCHPSRVMRVRGASRQVWTAASGTGVGCGARRRVAT